MYDYHSHSDFSDDCTTPLRDMVRAAVTAGIRELAVTDHYDPDYPDRNFPFELDFSAYHKGLEEVGREFSDRIRIVKGIEIGIQHGDTNQKCRETAAAYPYDFIIGSFHCTGGQDLYTEYFKTRSDEAGVAEFYEYVYQGIRDFQDFDVLGHINVIDRYVKQIPDYRPYMEIIEAILKELISLGKGIEINTSSFRYGMNGRTTPSAEILTLYKDLGGEIITYGSDAHRESHLGYKYKEAMEILQHHGFRYLATFRERKCTPILIP